MKKNALNIEKSGDKKGRLQNPLWLISSIAVTVFFLFVVLYSFYRRIVVLPVVAFLLLLLLWFFPIFWTKIEEIFGKRPKTLWGKFSLNLSIATLIAITLEDVFELVVKGIRLIIYFLGEGF